MSKNRCWWQDAIFYQIYPRSFADSNGDGIGDLAGIHSRLDYLQDLGVDAIWLSPHYPSPLFDCGYDIADYTAVAPEYGDLEAFKTLLSDMHERGMRLVLDLVLNHTSDQHPWFQESRSSRENPKRDWYIWRDGREGGPPNGWYSYFGGSAWQLDPQTGQYYYHFFFKEQPDLNWRNPEVRQAMFAAARFWLDLGVDGFRLDAIGTIFEDEQYRDPPGSMSELDLYRTFSLTDSDADWDHQSKVVEQVFQYQHDLPEVHGLMRELRILANEYPGAVLIGETDLLDYHGDGDDELNLVFNFPLMRTVHLTPAWIRANQQVRLMEIPRGSWPCNTLGNHDTSRVMTRFGDGIHNQALARLWPALLLTLKGTPFLYNGEEIGMTDLLLDEIGQFRDYLSLWAHRMEVEHLHTEPTAAVAFAARFWRDKNRTPMQWSDAPNGGFCPENGRPWLPVNPNCREDVNVADQAGDPASLLNFYRQMIRIRKSTPALIRGEYTPLDANEPGILAFLRTSLEDRQTCLVVLNWSDRGYELSFDLGMKAARLVFSSRVRSQMQDDLSHLVVLPYEIYIAELHARTSTGSKAAGSST